MGRLNYSEVIQNALNYHYQFSTKTGDVVTHAIYDTERDRYQLLRVGWRGSDRTFAKASGK